MVVVWLQREHSLFGTVMSALSLTRGSVIADSSYLPVTAAVLGVDTAPSGGGPAAGGGGKLSPTNSLQCPRAVKAPVQQNSISVRDLFPAAYARSSAAAGAMDPNAGTDSTATTAANHVPPPAASKPDAASTQPSPPQIVCNSPSVYSPTSSPDKSKSTGSPDRYNKAVN